MTSLRIARDRLGDDAASARLEYLVTNGIGGYASGTLGGALARRYHGLLIASLRPPVQRTLLLAKLAESVAIAGEMYELDCNHWASGAIEPRGHVHLESFELDGTTPHWTWAIGDTRLRKRVYMEQGANVTYIEYTLLAAPAPVTLALKALVTCRDHHETRPGQQAPATLAPHDAGVAITLEGAPATLYLSADGAECAHVNAWYRAFALALETERGLDDQEDLLHACTFTHTLAPGATLTVVASTEASAFAHAPGAYARRQAHESALLAAHTAALGKRAKEAPAWIRQLVLAADQFIVERVAADGSRRTGPDAPRSVLAGYPWFTDWGRDTMIALPGLTLATGRPELARAVLRLFAEHVDGGMLPNYYPDSGEPAEYNTVDAALWCFQAVRAYVDATQDDAFLRDVLPRLEAILAGYRTGTRYGIVVDPADGLVTQGADGVALTWMDARVEDWVVTPRRGKPVEINALWYNAHTAMARFAARLGEDGSRWTAEAKRIAKSFGRYWDPASQSLRDVLDGPQGDDASLRPNQIFAVSLPDSPLSLARQRAVVDAVGRALLTSHGLRSLAASDPGFRPHMKGDRRTRDAAYHMGTVWSWLLPHHALAHLRAYGDRDAALALLAPFGDLMQEMCIGTLPEVADGVAPYVPRGCFAQAWTVAETLRVWQIAQATRARAKPQAKAAASG